MGAPHPSTSVLTKSTSTQSATRRVLVASFDPGDAQWLQLRVGQALRVDHCLATVETVAAQLALPASAVVVVFDARADLSGPSQLVQWVRKYKTDVSVLGMGYANSAQVPLSALRAGVKDFLDIGATDLEDIRKPVWDACMRGNVERAESTSQGKVLALVGARAGMGVTTLAVHLCAALAALEDSEISPKSYEANHEDLGVGLLDLGFPLRDGQMLLGLNGKFHMVDAVQGATRLDRAMLEAALPRHTSGTAVLSWPAQSHALREVSPMTTASIVQKMRGFFAWQIVDVGGFPSPDIVQEIVQAADQVWVISDQSVGGIVSLSDLLKNLRVTAGGKGIDGLIVNRTYKSQGLPPLDIAKRLELPLLYALPHREEALLKSSSSGLLLSESSPSDPYVQEVKKMAHSLVSSLTERNGLTGLKEGAKFGKSWLGWLPGSKRSA
jgi:pilus assembly protein CpaE